MRRVVVTGMGIVSSIGNNTQEVLASLREAKSGIVRAEKYAELGFRCQVHGEPHLEWEPHGPAQGRAASWRRGIGWNYIAMDQAIRDAGLERERRRQRAHRHHHGLGRPLDARHRARRRYHAREGPQKGRPVRGAEGHVLGSLRGAGHGLPDQGRQLFDLVGLRHLGALHRQCRRDDPVGQAGRDVRRRLRGARLDAVGAVRRHGRHVHQVQRHARPRRAAPTTRTATASSLPAAPASWCWRSCERAKSARRQDLRRGRRATAPPPTASTWSRPRARAPCVACAWRCRASTARASAKIDYINPHGTGTPGRRPARDRGDPPGVRQATCRRSPPPSRSPAIRSARSACRRRSSRF